MEDKKKKSKAYEIIRGCMIIAVIAFITVMIILTVSTKKISQQIDQDIIGTYIYEENVKYKFNKNGKRFNECKQ